MRERGQAGPQKAESLSPQASAITFKWCTLSFGTLSIFLGDGIGTA